MEIINPVHARGPFRCAVIDFDGTLSLLRADWQGLMTRLGVEILAATPTRESRQRLEDVVREFVFRLTGQPTIAQMRALAAEVALRGKSPDDVLAYLGQYENLLMTEARARIDAVRSGRQSPDEHLVPGSRLLLTHLQSQELLLVIASGTKLTHVQNEAQILALDSFFGPRIFAPVECDSTFTKLRVIERLLDERGLRGADLVMIGDGPAEMQAARAVGALAIGVASDEVHRDGRVNPFKREHLVRAGADVIVPDYRDIEPILRILTPNA